jgi:hypothetical protein
MYRKQVAKFVSQRLRPRHLQGTWSKNVDSPAAMSMFRDLEQGFESLELFASQDEKEKTTRFIHDIVLIQVCLGHSKDTSKWIIRPTQRMRQNISEVRGASAILNALGFVEINDESQKSQGRRQKGWKWVKPRVWGGENPVHVIRAAAEACREEIENLVMTRKQQVRDLKRSSSLRHASGTFENKSPESTSKPGLFGAAAKNEKRFGDLTLQLNRTKQVFKILKSTTIGQVRNLIIQSIKPSSVQIQNLKVSMSGKTYVVFEREAREYLFSSSLTQSTKSYHLHNP